MVGRVKMTKARAEEVSRYLARILRYDATRVLGRTAQKRLQAAVEKWFGNGTVEALDVYYWSKSPRPVKRRDRKRTLRSQTAKRHAAPISD
jgi:hypothetical protein